MGVQIETTNETDEAQSVDYFEFSIFADGSSEAVSIHIQSNTEPLESIDAGETVQTWLFYAAPAGADTYEFDVTTMAEHSFELTHDENLSIELIEYEE